MGLGLKCCLLWFAVVCLGLPWFAWIEWEREGEGRKGQQRVGKGRKG